MPEKDPFSGPIFLTEDQVGIVALAVTRAREVTGNPLLDDVDVLMLIAEEYLADAEANGRLLEAQRSPPPRRRIAVE